MMCTLKEAIAAVAAKASADAQLDQIAGRVAGNAAGITNGPRRIAAVVQAIAAQKEGLSDVSMDVAALVESTRQRFQGLLFQIAFYFEILVERETRLVIVAVRPFVAHHRYIRGSPSDWSDIRSI